MIFLILHNLGEKLYFSRTLMEDVDINAEEYSYFLGQTLPFHTQEYSDFINNFYGKNHPILEPESTNNILIPALGFILDSNKKPMRWSTDANLFNQFVLIGNKLDLLPKLSKSNNLLICKKYPGITSIIHQDESKPVTREGRTHDDD